MRFEIVVSDDLPPPILGRGGEVTGWCGQLDRHGGRDKLRRWRQLASGFAATCAHGVSAALRVKPAAIELVNVSCSVVESQQQESVNEPVPGGTLGRLRDTFTKSLL